MILFYKIPLDNSLIPISFIKLFAMPSFASNIKNPDIGCFGLLMKNCL